MKPCQGILVNPIKGSLIVANHAAKPLGHASGRYAPPSKRKEEPKTLTKDEISSDILFPSLAPMKPMTSGASWSQLHTRLSSNPFHALSEDSPSSKGSPSQKPEMNFIRVIDERMKREKAEAEEGIRREGITQPSQMTMDQREANGWTTLRLPGTPSQFIELSERLAANKPLKEEDYYDSGHSFDAPWSRGNPVECVHLGGAPIQRTEKPVDHFANFSVDRTPVVVYSPISESSIAAAKAKFAGFFRKKNTEKYKL